MTAEIAVLNQQAVALAADSAVTVTGEQGVKIFASANKIFALSKFAPVGVMVYGTASVMRVPWETLIKVYRHELGDQQYDTLPEYAESFLRWLGAAPMFTDRDREEFVRAHARGMLVPVRDAVRSQVEAHFRESDEPLTEKDVRRLVRQATDRTIALLDNAPRRDGPADWEDQLLESYRPALDEEISRILENLPLSPATKRKLRRVAVAPFVRCSSRGSSGIVFAGFGRDDVFPRLRGYELDGVLLKTVLVNQLRFREMDITTDPDAAALVSGFAQSDVISLFMEGVLPSYEEFVEGYLSTVVSQYADIVLDALPDGTDRASVEQRLDEARRAFTADYVEDLQHRRYETNVEPILDVVGSLPKDELAGLAESLVNLTSLKRRISRDDETVGGPVDVAVISKGDGLIWIKRKHYFDPALNQQFFANYYRSGSDD